jgi:hypothetical protein
VLARKPRARAAEPRIDLVDDQQPSPCIAEPAQRGEEAARRHAFAAAALDRLDDHGADLRAADGGRAQDVVDVAESRKGGCVREPRCERRAKIVAVGGVECAEREAVVGAFERDDARTSRRERRGLERHLDGVAARRSEHGARRPAAREAPRQRFEQLDLHRRRVDVAHPVQQSVGLVGDRADDARVGVADVGDAERRAEVDIAVVVDVPDVRALRALPEDRLGSETRDVARLDLCQPRRERARARSRDRRAQRGQLIGEGGHARQCSCKIAS